MSTNTDAYRFRVVLAYVSYDGEPRFNIEERVEGAFWGFNWRVITHSTLDYEKAHDALKKLEQFAKENAS